jgi:hypothetical protein
MLEYHILHSITTSRSNKEGLRTVEGSNNS